MSFLAPTTIPPTAAAEPPISNDGWAPDIDLQQLRDALRLDGSVTPARLRQAAVAAILAVNVEIEAWRAEQLAAGCQALEDVPAPEIDGESAKVALYRRAVHCAVHADLLERMRDFDTTGAGDKRAERLELTVHDVRRDMRWAIADLVGSRRTTVELI